MRFSALGLSANDLLEAFRAQLIEDNADFDLPPNQYVGSGEIPWDGPGLYVYLGSGVTGQPGRGTATAVFSTSAITRTMLFYVQLLRDCSTFGYWGDDWRSIPANADLNYEGMRAMDDAGAMVAAAIHLQTKKIIVANPMGTAIGQIMPIGPQGGLVGMRLPLDLTIDQA
jgi:hypothetical protein